MDEQRVRDLLEGWRSARIGVVESVTRVRANPYGSRSTSLILDVVTGKGGVTRVLVKSGGDGELTRTGSPWGVSYETSVYRGPLEAIRSYDSPFVGHLRDGERSCLVLQWLGNAMPVAKTPHPAGIRSAAAWLGLFHREAAARLALTDCAELTRYRDGVVAAWSDLARDNVRCTLGGSSPVADVIEAAAASAQQLLGHNPTLVHGDLYPANVLVDGRDVVPVDWEWAGVAAGELDLAALVDGWPETTASACLADYRRARWGTGVPRGFTERFAAAQFYLAVRWLGGSTIAPGQPKSERYLREVLRAAATLDSPTGDGYAATRGRS